MMIRRLKILMLGTILLLIPMACMHLGDDHHSGPHHSMLSHPSFQSSIHSVVSEGMMGVEG